jgi:lipoprotein-anchoring transpeptidase ErfK/SrfK
MKRNDIRLSFFCTLAVVVTSLSWGAGILDASTARAEILIAINTAAQQMTVSVDGTKRWTWPVSTGAPGYQTPAGTYHVLRMEKDYASKEWDDAPMPFSIFFTKRGHAIHGSSHTKLLGRPASHGCVRLKPANASRLFELVRGRDFNSTTVTVN